MVSINYIPLYYETNIRKEMNEALEVLFAVFLITWILIGFSKLTDIIFKK